MLEFESLSLCWYMSTFKLWWSLDSLSLAWRCCSSNGRRASCIRRRTASSAEGERRGSRREDVGWAEVPAVPVGCLWPPSDSSGMVDPDSWPPAPPSMTRWEPRIAGEEPPLPSLFFVLTLLRRRESFLDGRSPAKWSQYYFIMKYTHHCIFYMCKWLDSLYMNIRIPSTLLYGGYYS